MAKTPVFSFRLKQELQDQIKEMGKAYGSPSPREFLRELIETVLSGDPVRVGAFNQRLIERATGQLQLKMEHDMKAAFDRGVASTTRTTRTTRKPRKKRKARNERTT